MNQYVGRFQQRSSHPNERTKWLGTDKYEKLIYFSRYVLDSETIEIIVQSIFGGNQNVINRSTCDNYILDSALGGEKQFVGFISFPGVRQTIRPYGIVTFFD